MIHLCRGFLGMLVASGAIVQLVAITRMLVWFSFPGKSAENVASLDLQFAVTAFFNLISFISTAAFIATAFGSWVLSHGETQRKP